MSGKAEKLRRKEILKAKSMTREQLDAYQDQVVEWGVKMHRIGWESAMEVLKQCLEVDNTEAFFRVLSDSLEAAEGELRQEIKTLLKPGYALPYAKK